MSVIEIARTGGAAALRELFESGAEITPPREAASIALIVAASGGAADVVSALLDTELADPTARNSEALRIAAERGRTAAVRVLLEDGRADPAAEESDALQLAAQYGHDDVVQLLLDDGRVDLECGGALRMAISGGHVETARLLLETGMEEGSSLLRLSVLSGVPGMVELQLRQAGDPDFWDAGLIAVERGHLSILRLLMDDPRFNFAGESPVMLHEALRVGRRDIIRELASDPSMDPEALAAALISSAASYPNFLPELLCNSWVTREACGEALETAVRNGVDKAVYELLWDGRVDPAARNNQALAKAAHLNFGNVVRALITNLDVQENMEVAIMRDGAPNTEVLLMAPEAFMRIFVRRAWVLRRLSDARKLPPDVAAVIASFAWGEGGLGIVYAKGGHHPRPALARILS